MPASRSQGEEGFDSRPGRSTTPPVVVLGDDEELSGTVIRALKARYEVLTGRLTARLRVDTLGVTVIVTKRLATVNPTGPSPFFRG